MSPYDALRAIQARLSFTDQSVEMSRFDSDELDRFARDVQRLLRGSKQSKEQRKELNGLAFDLCLMVRNQGFPEVIDVILRSRREMDPEVDIACVKEVVELLIKNRIVKPEENKDDNGDEFVTEDATGLQGQEDGPGEFA